MSVLKRAWRVLGDRWTICSHANTSIESPGPRRLRLRCLDCQRITGGWVLDEPRYRLTQPGDPERHRLVKPQAPVLVAVQAPIFPDLDSLAGYLATGVSDPTSLVDGPNRIQ